MGCFNSKEEDSSTNGFSNPIHGESYRTEEEANRNVQDCGNPTTSYRGDRYTTLDTQQTNSSDLHTTVTQQPAHRSDVFVNSDSPENQKETLQKKKKENKKKGKDHKTEPSHKNEVLKRNSKELGNPTTENKKETYNPLDAQETQQHKEKRKKKTKENDHEKKSRKEKKNKPQESEEANKGKITQTDVLVVQGPEVEQKTVEGQTKSSDLHTIVYQQQTANVKTQEDQLEKENDQFHEKSMSFGKENRTEIETLEQKLKDIKEENVKALAEKDDKIQALQNERDNILAKTKENSDKNERNWKELTEQLQQKDNKIKRLEMKHKELEEELEETLARYDKTCGKRHLFSHLFI